MKIEERVINLRVNGVTLFFIDGERYTMQDIIRVLRSMDLEEWRHLTTRAAINAGLMEQLDALETPTGDGI